MQKPDVILLLYRIKVNIRKVESGDINSLESIQEDFLELMELLKLFLISERETYYGYFLMNMSFKVDFKANVIAGIVLNEYPPVFISNPLLLCKFSLKEIIYIICHEIEHVILNHPAEMIKENPKNNPDIAMRFNYAADASVNDRLNHDIFKNKLAYMSFPEGCIDSIAFAKTFNLNNVLPNESYKYYFSLINDTNDEKASSPLNSALAMAAKKDAQDSDSDSNSGQGEEAEASGDEKGDKSGQGKGKPTEDDTDGSGAGQNGQKEQDDEVVTANNCGDVSTHQWECGSDPEVAQELAKEFVNEAHEMMSAEARGLLPAEFISQIEFFNKPPKISWEKILKKYVGTISADYRKTRMRLNRRQPERFDLSGKMNEKVLKIVVAIDTSASMSDEMISRVFDEIFGILSKKKYELTIIECDARIERWYRARNRSEVQKSVKGRGGTAFTPVINFINKDRYYRDALLIYFTDGFGESAIPKPRTYRNMWVIMRWDSRNKDSKPYLSVTEPYGIVVGI